jgi:raffinose/stachyose/melibiose transport system substrate-binding protein
MADEADPAKHGPTLLREGTMTAPRHTPAFARRRRFPRHLGKLPVLAVPLAVVLAVTGCGGGSGGGGGTKSTTLTAWVVKEDIPSKVLTSLGHEFEQSHPGVTVDIVPFSFNDLQVKGKLALAGPNPPDVSQVSIPPQVIAQLVKAGKLVNLDAAAQKYGWTKRYPASVLAYQQYDSDGTPYKGSLYGLPQFIAPIGVYYNREKLAKLKLGVPKTFADFEHALSVAKSAGETPMVLGELDKWPAIHLYGLIQNQLVSKDDLRTFVFTKNGTFDFPGSRTAAQVLQTWAKSGYLQDDFNGTSSDDAGKIFTRGTGVFYPSGTWVTADVRSGMGDNVGFFLMPPKQPSGDLAVTSSPNQPWVVPTKSANRDLAIEFLDFLSSSKAGSEYAKAGLIPAMTSPSLPKVSKLEEDVLKAGQAVLSKDATVPYLDVATATMYDTITASLQELLVQKIGPDEYVSRVQQNYEEAKK